MSEKLDFLSNEWFDKITELRNEMGDMEVPKKLKDVAVNISVTDGDKEYQLCLNAGNLEKGHKDGASTTLTLPVDIAKRLLIENDQTAAIKGLTTGKIKLKGSMTKMLALAAVKHSDDQEKLLQIIVEITKLYGRTGTRRFGDHRTSEVLCLVMLRR